MSNSRRSREHKSQQDFGRTNTSVKTKNEPTQRDTFNGDNNQAEEDISILTHREGNPMQNDSLISLLQYENLLLGSDPTNANNRTDLQPSLSDSIVKRNLISLKSQSMVELDSTDSNESKDLQEAQYEPPDPILDMSDDEIPLSDSEDDFISSDGDSISQVLSGQPLNSIGYGSTFSEHVLYFEKALDTALDLHQLDKSLVAQAKISGQLNDTNRHLIERLQELQESLQRLRDLFNYHITSKRIENLDADLKEINTRVRNLKQGSPKSLFFGKTKLGIMDKYPVEYNQARDKVLERPDDA